MSANNSNSMNRIVKRTEELLRQYDILRYQENKLDKLLAIEDELAKIRDESNKLSTSNFDLYPKLGDADFGRKLSLKKEFYKSKYAEFKDITRDQYRKYGDAVCKNQDSTFRLSQNQIFLKNFLAPKTPYNSILLFHGVGVGKCHGRGTKILMWSGEVKEVQDIKEGEYLMGDDGLPREVESLATGVDMLWWVRGGGVEWTGNSEHILCLKYFGQNVYFEPETSLWLMETLHPLTLKTVVASAESRSEIDNMKLLQQEQLVYEISIKNFTKLEENVRTQFKAFRVALSSGSENENENDSTNLLQEAFYLGSRSRTDPELTKTLLNEPVCVRDAWITGYMETNAFVDPMGRCLLKTEENDRDSVALLLRSVGFKINLHPGYIQVDIDNMNDLTYDITVEPYKEDEYFGFMISGNHRYLLEDFTVTHNTCTAVTIAENFHTQYKNKTLVLLPTSIKENFMRQIFDVSKLKSVTDTGENQCIAQKYLNLLPDRKGLELETLDNRVKKLIHDSYELMGFMEFGNVVAGIENAAKLRYEGNSKQIKAAIRLKLREKFSNRVIIIDEVHNARIDKTDTKKKVPPLLKQMLKAVQNVKLILCTATPMFNSADEIIQLLNYLRANEKLPQLTYKDLFEDGKVKPEALSAACRGLVSFMRGDNPFTFPLRLYPSFNFDKRCIQNIPSLDIKGNEIPPAKRLKSKEIIISSMSQFQGDIYKEVKKQKVDDDIDEIDPDESFELDDTKSHLSKPIQISNIVFPGSNEVYGKKGFEECFTNVGGNTYQFRYKTTIDYQNFLAYGNLGEYSAKLKTIVDYIKTSKGIVFVYSSYIWSALLPLALALEHMGMSRHGGESLLDDSALKEKQIGGSYTILVADKMFGVNINEQVKAVTDPNNFDGSRIKVILANSVVAEGIDFKCIREVHIVEPWYHQNKAEQIIGRAVRTCSHTVLPLEERNVTIYQHAAVVDMTTEQESIDLQIYRIAEDKQEAINIVQQILRDNSIDCQLNKGVSYFDPKILNFKSKVTSSQGVPVLGYKWGDTSDKFKTSCEAVDDGGKDDTTFDTQMYMDDVGYYADFIMALFRKSDGSVDYTKHLSYEKIQEGVNTLMSSMDIDILKFTLNAMLNAGKSRDYLAFVGRKYIMIPAVETFGYVTMKERKNYKPLEFERLVSKDNNTNNTAFINTNTQNDIVKFVNDEVAKCRKRLKEGYPSNLELPLLDYVIDRLTTQQLHTLFLHKDLLTTRVGVSSKPSIKGSLERAGAMLELEEDRYIYRVPFKHQTWMWRSDDENTLKEVPKEALNSHFRKINNLLNEHNHIDHTCFLDYNKTMSTYRLKLMNGKDNSTGCDCARTPTNYAPDLIKIISDIGYDYESILAKQDKANKEDLCFLIELAVRANDYRQSHINTKHHHRLKRPLHYLDYVDQEKSKKKQPANNNTDAPKKRGRKPKTVAAEN